MEEYGKRGRLPTDSSFSTCRMVGMGAVRTAMEASGARLANAWTMGAGEATDILRAVVEAAALKG